MVVTKAVVETFWNYSRLNWGVLKLFDLVRKFTLGLEGIFEFDYNIICVQIACLNSIVLGFIRIGLKLVEVFSVVLWDSFSNVLVSKRDLISLKKVYEES